MAINEFNFTPFGNGTPRWYLGTSVPTVGTYALGDVIFNKTPSVTAPAGWICTTGGVDAAFVFSAFGVAGSNNQQTTTATSGTLSTGFSAILLNPATTGTYSIPNVTAYSTGSTLFIKNLASGSTTLTALAANGADASPYTLAQNAKVTLRSGGGTTWYLQST